MVLFLRLVYFHGVTFALVSMLFYVGSEILYYQEPTQMLTH